MQLEVVLWWQNHFGIITLSQFLEHRYHVMHIRLPDKDTVVNHFCLQAFLPEESFPSFSYVLLFFILLRHFVVISYHVNFRNVLPFYLICR